MPCYKNRNLSLLIELNVFCLLFIAIGIMLCCEMYNYEHEAISMPYNSDVLEFTKRNVDVYMFAGSGSVLVMLGLFGLIFQTNFNWKELDFSVINGKKKTSVFVQLFVLLLMFVAVGCVFCIVPYKHTYEQYYQAPAKLRLLAYTEMQTNVPLYLGPGIALLLVGGFGLIFTGTLLYLSKKDRSEEESIVAQR
ncbi:Hypothetical_protein [Hexamita inflata]|uniref:Hypothetical_protein n=1 Tax=Hexamita inflata TaxID=28002 RepID=A0ABP1JXM8_9EUKA